jgi:predicted nucleic acid-binding protein
VNPIGREPDVPVPASVARFALDPGEEMVLVLALARRSAGDDVKVVLDELKGRRAAQALGLVLVGSAGLLLRARQDDRIDAVAPLPDELQARGMYLDDGLRRDVLNLAGE